MGSNKANWYDDKTRRGFVRFYRNKDLSMRKALDQYNFEGERTPSVATVWRWQNNIDDLGDREMTDDEKDKSAVDKIVHGSQVSESETGETADNYQGGDNEDKKEKEKGKQSGSPPANQPVDLSNLAGWIGEHKIQIGLAVAGIAAVVLVSRYRHTISVDQLQGHGESSSSESESNQDNSSNSELGDDDAWTGE